MGRIFSTADKILIWLSAIVTAIGLLPMVYVVVMVVTGNTTVPSGDVDLSLGILFFLGLGLAWIGVMMLFASLLYRSFRLRYRRQQIVFGVLLIIAIVSMPIFHHVTITIPSNEAQRDLERRQQKFDAQFRTKFVEYTGVPNWNNVTEESTTLSYTKDTSAALYLNECKAGRAVAEGSASATYFVFSGYKDGDCVFYIHEQPINSPAWDGLLKQRCIWNTNEALDNTSIFAASANGIQFDDFLTRYCQTV